MIIHHECAIRAAFHHECAIRAALLVLLTTWRRHRTLAMIAAIKILQESLEKEDEE